MASARHSLYVPPMMFGRPYWIAFGECFLLLLIGGVVWALWRSRRRIFSRDAVPPTLLTGLALLLRFTAHAGPADIRSVLDWENTARAGWTVLLNLMRDVRLLDDDAMWTVNRIVGALSVPLLFVVLRRRFAEPTVAVGGATALAVTPLIVRFSASDTPYILLCAFLLGALVCFDAFVESESTGILALSLGLLTAAMQLRQEAPWLVVPAALLALAGAYRRIAPMRLLRPPIVVLVLLFIALNAVPSWWALRGPTQGVSLQYFVLAGSLFGSPWADANTTPRLLLGLVILGAVAGVVQYRLRGVLWLGATLVALPLNTPAVAGPGISGYSVRPSMPVVVSQYANARYHLPSMYLACGLVGLGGAALMEALRRFRGRPIPAAGLVTAGIICAAAAPRFDLLQRMWAPQREFEVFRDGLHRIDPSCRVVTLLNTIDAGMIPFRYLAPERLSDLSEFVAAPTLDHCVIYYRCANCYAQDLVPWKDWATFDVNPACREIEERFQLDPIIETKIAALPFRAETYSRDPLPLGFYRVRERAADSGAVKRTGESAPGAATR